MEYPETTLSETLNLLRKEGYLYDFNLRENLLHCSHNGEAFGPEDLVIDRVFRFEGDSNPDDAAVLYAISSPKVGLKGVLVDGFGISSNEDQHTWLAQVQKA
ncbi:MAG TPA: phosphoribosylpyrophosphate synthetase [Cytophagales bacterium]|nr:phosphoribosylpyrophosphate synthetase [Cytophagales bacterium]HAA18036.1 phosphoribosylpyrophosphate synthetase [Cytophagales bacterium]HAP63056.1 phosphoribosylpyrophosphate synthetase [Cytophagales bacterium]